MNGQEQGENPMKEVIGRWSGVGKGVFCIALSALLFALCASAEAQQPLGADTFKAVLNKELKL